MTMNSPLVIRNARPSDVTALSVLAQETYSDAFGHSFSEADLAAHLAKHLSPDNFTQILEKDVVLLAEVSDCIIGYAQFGAPNDSVEPDRVQELRRLYVRSEYQSKGVGGALMEAVLSHPHMKNAATILLDVWEHNPGAQRFYQRYSFEVIGTRVFKVEFGAETSPDLIMARRQHM